MDYIDLRSDTVSHPTPAMREAMFNAELGDDVYGEDPHTNALEAEAAEMFGKEAGLFVTSGSQGNMAALLAHCGRGDEIIVGEVAHTIQYEVGGMAAMGGIMPHTIPVNDDGTFNLDDVRHGVRGSNVHFPRTSLIAMENSHGGRGGAPVSKQHIDDVAEIAQEHGLNLHIDGARIFNAATALDTPVKDLTENADSITFCLSKGLCAPAGSVLVGDKAFIDEARRMRKMLGGGMRQAGVLAAAGRIALNAMSLRLAEDHQNACDLAEGLATIDGLDVDVKKVKTNFVFFTLREDAKLQPDELITRLWDEHNIQMRPYPGYVRRFRCVTHYWITPERVQTTVNAVRDLLA
ncbi:MAG: low-specificity L-threonine aldolase [Chloroflexota bacterium]